MNWHRPTTPDTSPAWQYPTFDGLRLRAAAEHTLRLAERLRRDTQRTRVSGYGLREPAP